MGGPPAVAASVSSQAWVRGSMFIGISSFARRAGGAGEPTPAAHADRTVAWIAGPGRGPCPGSSGGRRAPEIGRRRASTNVTLSNNITLDLGKRQPIAFD